MAALSCVLFVVLALAAAPVAGQQAPDEDALRAAMVFNLMLFVDWPEIALERTARMRLCVVTDDPGTGRAFAALGGRQIKGRSLEVQRRGPLGGLADCHAVYLNGLPRDLLADKLASIARRPVLTLSSVSDSGAMIDVTLADSRLAFDVSANTLRDAGLSLAARVMQLARTIHQR